MFRKMIAALLVLSVLCPSVPLFAHAAQAESPEQEAQSAEEETSEVSAREDSAQTPKDYMLGASTGAETVAPPATRTVSNGTCGENLTWTLDTDSGVLTISGSGAMTDFSENSAPWYTKRSYIKTVVVEEGVTTLGVYAFRYCTALTSIALPSSLQQINTLCFQECTALSEITLPEGLTTIGYGAFNLCGLTAIHLPATLTSIELRAFYGCTALNKITIAEENPAFLVQDGVLYNKDITKLILCPGDRVEPLVIPDTVTYIESDGFSNCTRLTELTLPDGLPLVGNPFSFCNGLLNIHVYDSNPNYAEVDGVLFSKNLQNLLKFPCGRTGRYDIPNGTVVICSEAFCRMKNPMVVTMPDTVEVIASRAFSYSTGLTQITLSGGLREIYSGAFEGCTQMGNVILPETLTLLDAACFDSCRSMTEITVPAQVARVSSRAFRSCSSLKKVVLEGRVTEIGGYAFALCSALESINFPEGLTSIGANAFEQCGNLAEAQLPSTLTALGLKVFCNCSALSEIEIPQGVEVIPVSAFSGCSALAKVILPKGLLRIDSAFDDTSISQLVIPKTVTEITDGAFYGCSQLSTVYFLGDAPTATKAAFRFCADTLVLYYTKDAQGWSSPSWNELPTALWSYTFSTTADCVNGGIEAFRSEDCDLVYTRRVLPYGHTFGDWYLAARPTQAAEGRWERVCSVCSYVDTEPIPALVLPEQTPAVTNNIGRQSYSVWAAPVKSYLVDNHDGTATRVEATSTDITVERYDAEKQFLSRQTLPMELPLFGGFYEGTDYFFLVFGQNNPEEDDNTEVIRVVGYTKDWLRMGQASLYGANTYIPFRAGSLRMTQYQDMLYVHTCHEMYKSIDGKHHQANLIFSVSIPEMEITDQQSRVMNAGYGYISHSFNQFVLTDGDKLLTLNHGDAYPRSAVIIQYDKPAGQTQFTGTCTYTCFLTFTGDLGDNFTGASFGAFELTDSAYLTAGNSILQDDSVALTGQRNIFLGITPRGDIGTAVTSLRWITNYADGANIKVSTPHLVRIQGDRFLLLWTEDDLLRYVFVDDMGNTVSEIYEANLPLSGCKPIVWNNAVCWYMTQNSVPAFFSIPIDQPDAPQIYAPELTVTLEPDGGVLDGDTITVSYGQPYGELPVPQRKSAYQFLGWYPTKQYYYTEIDPAEQITGDTMVTAMQDHTLYAHWRFLPHTCAYEVAEIIPANCTTGKITVFACVYCDSSYRVNDGVAGHAWDEGTVTTQPTCTQPGEIAYRCTLCDATKTESIPITGHSYTVTVVAPTCTNSGYTLRTCHCGQSLKDSYTQALGHDWDEGTVTTAPTCSSSGIKTYHCTRCTETRTEVLVQTGHTYTKVITPPTCTALGYTTYTCHCGYSYIGNYTNALGHEWDEGTVTTAPTCSSSGIKTYHCTRCTETRTEVLVQTGHTYTKVITPPTCTALGYTTYTCHCGYSYIGNYTDALGHEWDEGTVTTAPTCTQRGEKTFLCTRCEATKTETVAATGHIYTEAVTPATCTAQGYTTHTCAACGNSYQDTYTAALGHDWNVGTVTTAPTCTQKGEKLFRCKRCEAIKTESLPAKGHSYTEAVTPPTCTAQGYTTHTCAACGNSYQDTYTAVLGHDWNAGTVTTAPTCTQKGEKLFRCRRCEATKTESLPAKGHSYTGTVTPPTCTAQGYTTHTCTACGNSYQDTYTAALGHDWNAGTVTTTPTCTQKGEKLFRCRRCEATKTESLPAKGHSYTETVTPPTCTEQGYTTYACHCGYSYQGGYVSGLGHDFGEWVTTQEPTCTEAGTAVRACTRCSEKLTIPIEALGHNEQIVVTEPTCTTQGYNTHTCIRCQESYQDRFTDPLGHLWNGGEITKAPTATERGEKTYTCERCAETRTESIPATGEQAETSCDGGKNCPSAKFRDVSAKEWYHLYVDYVVAHGLFGGTSNTTFEPETAMTRAMLVTLLWRYEGNPAEGENTFTDVPEGTWYTEAVAWAAANGVVNGVGSNRFDPEGELTREQMAALLFRYAQQKGIDTSERGSLLSFLDGGRVSSWAEDAIQWTVAEGIIAGSDGCLLPQGNATRAQVAAILTRFIENIVKSE